MVTVATAILSYNSTPLDDTTWVEVPMFDQNGNTVTAVPYQGSEVTVDDTSGTLIALGVSNPGDPTNVIQQEIISANQAGQKLNMTVGTGVSFFVRCAVATDTATTGGIVIKVLRGRHG